jgi:hypothetical protein
LFFGTFAILRLTLTGAGAFPRSLPELSNPFSKSSSHLRQTPNPENYENYHQDDEKFRHSKTKHANPSCKNVQLTQNYSSRRVAKQKHLASTTNRSIYCAHSQLPHLYSHGSRFENLCKSERTVHRPSSVSIGGWRAIATLKQKARFWRAFSEISTFAP